MTVDRTKQPKRAVSQFYVQWKSPPSDEIVISAGARALQMYAQRTALEDQQEPPLTPPVPAAESEITI